MINIEQGKSCSQTKKLLDYDERQVLMTNTHFDKFLNNVDSLYRTNWLKPSDVCTILGVTKQTLYRNRQKHIGIPYVKVGNHVVYLKKDVIEYVKSHYVGMNEK